MLQQTQVKTVLPYWERWMAAFPNFRALAGASSQQIHKLWEGLGYYTRVRNMQKTAQMVEEQHRGEFPEDYPEVLALPGIGRYTAGAICSIAFNQRTPVLDGNVMRVLTRLFGIGGDPREKPTNETLWRIAEALAQGTARPGKINQALMELGAIVCTPRKPHCADCPLARACLARKLGLVERLPELARRPPTTHRRFFAFVAQRRGRVLIQQRKPGTVNAHLWEFPNVEILPGDGDPTKAAAKCLGARPCAIEPFFTVKHSITRYRIAVDVFKAEAARPIVPDRATWVAVARARRLPFTSAHKRILDRL
jgi:A/G-specific adenine glycosylase